MGVRNSHTRYSSSPWTNSMHVLTFSINKWRKIPCSTVHWQSPTIHIMFQKYYAHLCYCCGGAVRSIVLFLKQLPKIGFYSELEALFWLLWKVVCWFKSKTRSAPPQQSLKVGSQFFWNFIFIPILTFLKGGLKWKFKWKYLTKCARGILNIIATWHPM